MFDDIIKKEKYSLSVIKRDLEVYFAFLKYDIMDTITLNRILLDVNAYLSAYYNLQTSDVHFDFTSKTVIIGFDYNRLEFPVVN